MSSLKRLFAVETLDTRFDSKTQGQSLSYARPSKWRTFEYYFYYLCLLTIPVFMFKAVYDVSGPWHPSYKHYGSLLEPGWIPGRRVDNSDAQYRGFRENIPYMAILLVAHPLLRRLYDTLSADTTGPLDSSVSKEEVAAGAADARKESRIKFDVGFAIIFTLVLHGVSAIKVFLILFVNYQVATALPRHSVPAATWLFNIGILFANELCRGYPLAGLASLLLPTQTTNAGDQSENWGSWIDSYGGLIPRWEVLFNICVLRLISFNFDHYWSFDRRASSPIEVSVHPKESSCRTDGLQKKGIDPASYSERDRVDTPPQSTDFSFRNYVAYVLYSPLYLAGPILTFNDYIHQQRYRLPSINRHRIGAYALRFAICLLTMEVVLHFLYAVAISKSNPEWSIFSPFQLSMLGYFNLHIIWLKLLLPWRFFRLWSLVDGIDPPENMVRCMSDNYSAMAFWRGWHRSFNRWIMRYIYIPLGGSRSSKPRAIANFLAVFTFVALWHDINLRLLAWGWLVTLFVLPEVIATLLFPAKKWKDRPEAYRIICGIGAVGNVLMMMAANLVGFAVGLDGLKSMVGGMVDTWGGRSFLLAACATLFVGVQVMFEWRESEKRRGIDMKC